MYIVKGAAHNWTNKKPKKEKLKKNEKEAYDFVTYQALARLEDTERIWLRLAIIQFDIFVS